MIDINESDYELDVEAVCDLLPLNKVVIDESCSGRTISVNGQLLVDMQRRYIVTTLDHKGPGYLTKTLVNIEYAKELSVLKNKQGN